MARLAGINHVGLEVGDLDEARKAEPVLSGMGLEGLGKSDETLGQLREKGLG